LGCRGSVGGSIFFGVRVVETVIIYDIVVNITIWDELWVDDWIIGGRCAVGS
jgi:hypothetical protein